jgi:hypothetical protein
MPVDYKSRLKSLAWRVSMMILAVGLDWGLQNVGILVPTQYTVLAGLILGEISKEIRNQIVYKQEIERLEQ